MKESSSVSFETLNSGELVGVSIVTPTSGGLILIL